MWFDFEVRFRNKSNVFANFSAVVVVVGFGHCRVFVVIVIVIVITVFVAVMTLYCFYRRLVATWLALTCRRAAVPPCRHVAHCKTLPHTHAHTPRTSIRYRISIIWLFAYWFVHFCHHCGYVSSPAAALQKQQKQLLQLQNTISICHLSPNIYTNWQLNACASTTMQRTLTFIRHSDFR